MNEKRTVESLESRRLLSVTPTLGHGGVLHVVGDAGVENQIVVGLAPGGTQVAVKVNAADPVYFDAAKVRVVVIDGREKKDTITIEQVNGAFTKRTFINARGGDDMVWGGDEDDVIEGGAGNDILHAGKGRDVVCGGEGNDWITGDEGIDMIDGGQGNDSLEGGDGSDIIRGGQGNDTVNGGAGADWMYGGDGDDLMNGGDGNDHVWGNQGNDVINGDAGNDVLWGCAGNDTVNGGAGDDTLGGIVGHNNLIGGAGKDTFLVRSLAANPTNDYSSAEDVLRLVPGPKADCDDPAPVN